MNHVNHVNHVNKMYQTNKKGKGVCQDIRVQRVQSGRIEREEVVPPVRVQVHLHVDLHYSSQRPLASTFQLHLSLSLSLSLSLFAFLYLY